MMIAVLVLLILRAGAVSTNTSVTFANPNPCALKGSSVEFRCSYNYTYGENVIQTTWYKGQLIDGIWIRVELSHLPTYQNRSEYLGNRQHDCSLAIHDVQENDTGYYYFRFDTERVGWRSRNSVHLSVTELSARVYPDVVKAGENVTLECRTSCLLPSTVWFKDGRPLAKPVEFRAQAKDSGNYSCGVKGPTVTLSDPVALDVQYLPLNMSVEVSIPGILTEGSSVNLTCSSDANPAADNYTWYQRTASPSSLLQVGSGRVLSLPSVEASHAGFYLCRASNTVGEDNSTEVLLTFDKTDVDRFILLVGIGIKVVVLLVISLVIIWAWTRRCNSAVDEEENSHNYDYISPALMDEKNKVTQKEMSV